MVADLSSLDFSEISPHEFARIVKSADRGDLHTLMAGPTRERVLDEVFARMADQFRSDVGAHLHATVRWRLRSAGEEAETTYELTMTQGQCTTSKGASDVAPRVTITIGDVDFLKLVSGNTGGPTLFMTRKLRADGDLGLAASLTRYFDIPRA